MTQDQLNLWLAFGTFAVSVAVLILARLVMKSKASRRISEFAEELGLSDLDPAGKELARLAHEGTIRDPGEARSIVSAVSGTFEGRRMLLAEVQGRTTREASRAKGWRLLYGAAEDRVGRFLRPLLRGNPRAVDHLAVIFVEPVSGLPEFRLWGPSTAGYGRGVDRKPDAADGIVSDRSRNFEPGIEPAEARGRLPEAFLDRAARVLVGRPSPWVVEGAGGRLLIRISNWTPASNARSYRAILEDAGSIRKALEVEAEGEGEAEPRADRQTGGSLRSALERIRGASTPEADPNDPG